MKPSNFLTSDSSCANSQCPAICLLLHLCHHMVIQMHFIPLLVLLCLGNLYILSKWEFLNILLYMVVLWGDGYDVLGDKAGAEIPLLQKLS